MGKQVTYPTTTGDEASVKWMAESSDPFVSIESGAFNTHGRRVIVSEPQVTGATHVSVWAGEEIVASAFMPAWAARRFGVDADHAGLDVTIR